MVIRNMNVKTRFQENKALVEPNVSTALITSHLSLCQAIWPTSITRQKSHLLCVKCAF